MERNRHSQVQLHGRNRHLDQNLGGHELQPVVGHETHVGVLEIDPPAVPPTGDDFANLVRTPYFHGVARNEHNRTVLAS